MLGLPLLGQNAVPLLRFEFNQGSTKLDYFQSSQEPGSFYRVGQHPEFAHQRILTNKIAIKYHPRTDLQLLRLQIVPHLLTIEDSSRRIGLITCSSPSEALLLWQQLSQNTSIETVEPLLRFQTKKKSFNDPFYLEPNDDASPYQWYLYNYQSYQSGLNLANFWPNDPGLGINIAIVDDGIDFSHEDLGNAKQSPAINLNSGNPNSASIQSSSDEHGTAIAGIIGASCNGKGIVGIAHQANLYGIRLSAGPVTDSQIAQSLGWENDLIDIYNHGWEPGDESTYFDGPGLLAETALINSITNGRSGKGAIHVWPAGNGHQSGDQSNFDGFANSRYTIAVGAVARNTIKSYYSEEGANLVTSAPSDGGGSGIVTTSFEISTDGPFGLPLVESTYRTDFGGTSAAAAMVSGTVALMLQANPELSWREIQNLLMLSSVITDSKDSEWQTNYAGRDFNPKYGAGLLDVQEAIGLAEFSVIDANLRLPPAVEISEARTPSLTLPDNNGQAGFIDFDLSAHGNLQVEHVELSLDFTTTRRSDLELVLFSPSGTSSVLSKPYADTGESFDSSWTFLSNQFWGEGSAGIWNLRATDVVSGETITINSATLTIHGANVTDAPLSTAPFLISSSVLTCEKNVPFSFPLVGTPGSSITASALPEGVSFNSETQIISGSLSIGGIYEFSASISKDGLSSVLPVILKVAPTVESLGDAIGQEDKIPTSSTDFPWERLNQSVATPSELPQGASSFFALHDYPQGVLIFDWTILGNDGAASRLELFLDEISPENSIGAMTSPFLTYSLAISLAEESNSVFWNFTKNDSTTQAVLSNVMFLTPEEYQEAMEHFMLTPFEVSFTSPVLWSPYSRIRSLGTPGAFLDEGTPSPLNVHLEGPGTFIFQGGASMNSSNMTVTLNGEVLLDAYSGSFTSWSYQIPPGQHLVTIAGKTFIRPGATAFHFPAIVNRLDLQPFGEPDAYTFADFSRALPEGQNGPYQDWDNDGQNNLTTYALRYRGSPSPRVEPIQIRDDEVTYLVSGFATDVRHTLQESIDLENWSDTPDTSFVQWIGHNKEYRAPRSGSKKHYRLKFELIP